MPHAPGEVIDVCAVGQSVGDVVVPQIVGPNTAGEFRLLFGGGKSPFPTLDLFSPIMTHPGAIRIFLLNLLFLLF